MEHEERKTPLALRKTGLRLLNEIETNNVAGGQNNAQGEDAGLMCWSNVPECYECTMTACGSA